MNATNEGTSEMEVINAEGRQDTKLEAQGAEFLVLGFLLVEGISCYKAYINFRGYDLEAVAPDGHRTVRIQVKSRWATNYDKSFPIKNFECDFVVHVALNRGYRFGKKVSKEDSGIRDPEFYVFPVEVVKQASKGVETGKQRGRRQAKGSGVVSQGKQRGRESFHSRASKGVGSRFTVEGKQRGRESFHSRQRRQSLAGETGVNSGKIVAAHRSSQPKHPACFFATVEAAVEARPRPMLHYHSSGRALPRSLMVGT